MSDEINRDNVVDVYELTENPFTGRFQATLYPEKAVDLERLYAVVDGLRRALDNVKYWADTLMSRREQPHVVLISGPKGSGRTSAARYIAYRCGAAIEKKSAIPRTDDLLSQWFVASDISDEHAVAPLLGLVINFYHHTIKLGVGLSENLSERLLQISGEENLKAPAYYQTLYSLIRVATKMRIPIPILCLERVRNIRQILTALDAFGTDCVLICTTSIDAVARDFQLEMKKGTFDALHLSLAGLAAEEVVDFVEQRWKTFATKSDLPPPIPASEIASAFDSNWPIRGVVLLIDEILSTHCRKQIEAHAGSPVLPVTKDEIKDGIIRVLWSRGAEFRE